METIKHRKGIKNYRIELYENIYEMPIENFAQMEKNLIIESGVGSTITDFDTRLQTLAQFVSSGHTEKGMNEINNLRNLFWNITQNITPGTDAYSCFVATINGKEVKCTESGIKETSGLLKRIGYTKKMIDQKNSIKKKMDDQLKGCFPNLFDNVNIELIGATKRKMIAELDQIINDEDNGKKIEQENRRVSDCLYSRKFGNHEGEDVQHMKRYTKMCMNIQSTTNINPRKLTVYDFYSLVELQKAA